MPINACTFACDQQMPFVRTSIYSFIQRNQWFDGTIRLIIHPDFPLTDSNFRLLLLIYPDLEQVHLDREISFLAGARSTPSIRISKIKSYCKVHAFSLNEPDLLYFDNGCLFMKDLSPLIQPQKIVFTPEKSIIYIGSSSNIFTNFSKNSRPDLDDFLDEEFNKIEREIVDDGSVVLASSLLDSKFNQLSKLLAHAKCIFYPDALLAGSGQHSKIKQIWMHKNREVDLILSSPKKIIGSKKNNLPVKKEKRISLRTAPKSILFSPRASTDLTQKRMALCTICTDSFLQGAKVLIYSFLSNNLWFNQDIVIFYNRKYSPLSEASRFELKKLYDRVIFIESKEEDYAVLISRYKKMPGANPRFIPSFFTFDSFLLSRDYDRVLYLDSDMLVRADISELFSLDCELAVTPDTSEYNPLKKFNQFNGGLLAINGEATRKRNYQKALIEFGSRATHLSLAEQTIMNSYFKDTVTYLTSNYNCLKRCFPDPKFDQLDPSIKIIHYVGSKPWQNHSSAQEKNYRLIEGLWQDYVYRLEHDSQVKNREVSSSQKVLVLTSSFEGDISPFLTDEFIVFSTNWGICHGVPIDYYFCSADEPALISEITDQHHLIKKWIVIDSIRNRLPRQVDRANVENIFDFFSKNHLIGKNHVLPKPRRGGLNLPTSGVQMICAAANLAMAKLFIRGVNLYSIKNSNGGYKAHGNTYLENPYLMPTKPHDLATDLGLLYQAFKKLISQSIEIDADAPILNDLLELVKNETPVHLCQEIISKKYY